MQIDKSPPCKSSSQDGGATFDAAYLAGGSKTGGTRIAAPKVVVTSSGGVTISGRGTVLLRRDGTNVSKGQVIMFSVSCQRAVSCFGATVDDDIGLEPAWKFIGASCVQGPQGTVRMKVTMRMSVKNGYGNKNWA